MKKDPTAPRPRGRPRKFDREAALQIAVRMFWRRGFEATGIQDLADAMGLAPPSLYAAFGDKKTLFREAIAAYQAGPGAFARRAAEDGGPAREVIAASLRAAAHAFTDGEHPPGCMVILSTTNHGPGADDLAAWLRTLRTDGTQADWTRRIERDVADGLLPAGTDAAGLARFYMTVLEGMSIQAGDGADRAALEAVATLAMTAWPAQITQSTASPRI
ncbi:TetR/AcrR family transcriptional regulator [Siculibacillus lacustris]|nr:TetR/AcrR family transcriptional regulator [Siculibacillus lacustris]